MNVTKITNTNQNHCIIFDYSVQQSLAAEIWKMRENFENKRTCKAEYSFGNQNIQW